MNDTTDSVRSTVSPFTPSGPIEAGARAYLAAGLSIIPIRPVDPITPKGKAPAIGSWQEYQKRLPTEAELCAWFDHHPERGLAAVCGAVSGGLEVIDIDAREVIQEFGELVKESCPGLWERLTIATTPRGGLHLVYRCAEFAGNRKLAMREVDDGGTLKKKVSIETRGEGGYFLLSGSPGGCHPSGKTYAWSQGDHSTIPMITPDEREVLLVCARSFDKVIEAERIITGTGQKAPGPMQGMRPGDDFNARAGRAEIAALLSGDRWRQSRKDGKLGQLWMRPGSNTPSATLMEDGTVLVYSENADPIPRLPQHDVCTAYRPFAVLGLLKYNGDFKAAAKALVADGYGRRAPDFSEDQIARAFAAAAIDPEPQSAADPPAASPHCPACTANTPAQIAKRISSHTGLKNAFYQAAGVSDEVRPLLDALIEVSKGRPSFDAHKINVAFRVYGERRPGRMSPEESKRQRDAARKCYQRRMDALRQLQQETGIVLVRASDGKRYSKKGEGVKMAPTHYELPVMSLLLATLDLAQQDHQFGERREAALRRAARTVIENHRQAVQGVFDDSEPSKQEPHLDTKRESWGVQKTKALACFRKAVRLAPRNDLKRDIAHQIKEEAEKVLAGIEAEEEAEKNELSHFSRAEQEEVGQVEKDVDSGLFSIRTICPNGNGTQALYPEEFAGDVIIQDGIPQPATDQQLDLSAPFSDFSADSGFPQGADSDFPQPGFSALPQPEPQQPDAARVAFFITRDQRQQLLDRGHSRQEIDRMTPGEAHRILGLSQQLPAAGDQPEREVFKL